MDGSCDERAGISRKTGARFRGLTGRSLQPNIRVPSQPSSVSPRAGTSVAEKKRSRSKRQWWLICVSALVAAGVIVALALEYGWWGELVAAMERVNPVLTVLLMALLPLAGFSIGIVYVVAGLKFGLAWGGLVIVGVTAVHLLGTHWIVRSFLRGPIERFLKRRAYRLPEFPTGAEKSLAAMVALVPGPPYFLRNYALAFSGIPVAKYFWPCLLIYTARSYVTLALGDLGGDPGREGMLWLAGIFALKIVICGFLIRRIRRKHREMAGKQSETSHVEAVNQGVKP
jgi:uncharacterized membrane protein YdjX (TVP38/TMEM64 family)